MNTGCPFFDHAQHEFISIKHSAEPGFGICDNRSQKSTLSSPFSNWNLVARRSARLMRRITMGTLLADKGLVGIRGPARFASPPLATAQVNRFEPGLGHLDRLIARESAHRGQTPPSAQSHLRDILSATVYSIGIVPESSTLFRAIRAATPCQRASRLQLVSSAPIASAAIEFCGF